MIVFCCGFTVEPGKQLFENQDYPGAEKYFKQALKGNSKLPQACYYAGRALLAQDKSAEALIYFDQAVSLVPENPEYYFWRGVANWSEMEFDKERENYEMALAIDPHYIPAMVYLGHNYLDRGNWDKALEYYQKIIGSGSLIPEVLFNRALLLKKLKRTGEEISAWKAYLKLYPSGMWAVRSTEYLNEAGDFSYRIHLLGARKIVIKSFAYLNGQAKPGASGLKDLDRIGHILKNNADLTIHVVVYKNGHEAQARARSRWIKGYMTRKFQIPASRLKTSWFGAPEEIGAGQKTVSLNESVRFITDTGGRK